jgi:hypothetical protein
MHIVILPTVCVKEDGLRVLFYTVTNFRKPRHSHVISQGNFAQHLGTVAPLKDG